MNESGSEINEKTEDSRQNSVNNISTKSDDIPRTSEPNIKPEIGQPDSKVEDAEQFTAESITHKTGVNKSPESDKLEKDINFKSEKLDAEPEINKDSPHGIRHDENEESLNSTFSTEETKPITSIPSEPNQNITASDKAKQSPNLSTGDIITLSHPKIQSHNTENVSRSNLGIQRPNPELLFESHIKNIESKDSLQERSPYREVYKELPPYERLLSPETLSLVNDPIPSILSISSIDFEFSKIISLILNSKGYLYTQDFLKEVTDLSIIHFHDIIGNLKKFSEIQRRRKPSLSDAKLALKSKKLKPNDIFVEYERSKTFEDRKGLSKINDQIKHLLDSYNAEAVAFDEEDPSLPFFTNEHYEITELVPKESGKPVYVPSYLPDLPPDYTYQNTSKYMDQIKDTKQIRLKLVEESRLTDSSLYDLIANDDRTWRKEFELRLAKDNIDLLESDEESIMSDAGIEKDQTDTETPLLVDDKKTLNDDTAFKFEDQKKLENEKILPKVDNKSFDFVEYARKRKLIQQNQEEKILHKRKLREENIFFKAEKLYSPYATSIPTADDDLYFRDVITNEFKAVISAVRKAEKKKERKIQKILQEKERKEREMENKQESVQFGFSFGDSKNILEDNDSDSDDDNVNSELVNDLKFDDGNEEVGKEDSEHAIEVEPSAFTNDDLTSLTPLNNFPKEQMTDLHVQKETLQDEIGINSVGVSQVVATNGEVSDDSQDFDDMEDVELSAPTTETKSKPNSPVDVKTQLEVLEDAVDEDEDIEFEDVS